MSIGVIFMSLSILHWTLRARSLRMEADLVAQYQIEAQEEERIIPTRIFIEWFLNTPIEPQIYQDGQWTISPDQASYLMQSAAPGENGNTIIYGHNKRSILGNIRALKGNEIIVLTLSDGTTREYQINFITEVDPTETEFLEPTDTETLTIYTCSGLFDSKRFIVQAVPIDQQN
jgi:LPXTG-site transpeptidase (sortase) family protein